MVKIIFLFYWKCLLIFTVEMIYNLNPHVNRDKCDILISLMDLFCSYIYLFFTYLFISIFMYFVCMPVYLCAGCAAL